MHNRGACCIVCRPNSISYKVNMKTLQQQQAQTGQGGAHPYFRFASGMSSSPANSIIEFNIHEVCRQPGVGSIVDVRTAAQLQAYLSGCKNNRVDIILLPYYSTRHSNACTAAPAHDLWLPYWENNEVQTHPGTIPNLLACRKMAPQFRSQGVGSLRLGESCV